MGILHRDIKPDNFLLADVHSDSHKHRYGVMKLSDFGLSIFYYRGVPEKEVRSGHEGLTDAWLM